MVLLARKHAVDPSRLIDAFIEAQHHQVAYCDPLKITCRRVNQESFMFLVEHGEQAVWQFPVQQKSLHDPKVLKKYLSEIPLVHRKLQMSYATTQQIANLKYGMKGIDVTATILEVPPPTRVFTRLGSEAYVSNARIADASGSVRLTLWNNHIKTVQVGDEVDIKNCYVSRFQGQLQVRLGRHSTLSIIPSLQSAEPGPSATIS
jgi:hypothetical protein